MSNAETLALAQVALVTAPATLAETEAFYGDVLGFLPAGKTSAYGGELVADLQRLSERDPKPTMVWMVGRDEAFQLELFAYDRPTSRPLPADWTPRDVGLSVMTLWAEDYDAVVARARDGGAVRVDPAGAPGDRVAMLADPNGILIELVERDPTDGRSGRPGVGIDAVGVRLAVADLEVAARFLEDELGLRRTDRALHVPEDEALWGLAGATPQVVTYAAGALRIEIAQYADPAGRRRPDGYELSDLGYMNIALSTPDADIYTRAHERVVAAGRDCRQIDPSGIRCTYISGPDDLNVEILHLPPETLAEFGFVPLVEAG